MIGIIGYGMVGKAVEYGFPNTQHIISDPFYNEITIQDVVSAGPEAIFVCVPTPTDETQYTILDTVLNDIIYKSRYQGLTVVKSTVLPKYLEKFDIIFNPEFLSRATSYQDFISPPLVVIGGNRAADLLDVYNKYSIVDTSRTFLTDVKTAALVKYTFNTFYATKITFMNQMYDVAEQMGVNFKDVIDIVQHHPWVGTSHLQVPGPDGERGFGGPCLPKDTAALVREYDLPLLDTVLSLNSQYRP